MPAQSVDEATRSSGPEGAQGLDALGATLLGFGIMAVANAIGSAAQLGVRAGALGQRAAHLGFIVLHHALLAMAIVVILGPWARWLRPRLSGRRRHVVAVAASFALGLAAFYVALDEDLGGFPALLAFGMTAVLALGFPLLVVVSRAFGHRWWGRGLLVAGAIGTLPPNHVVMKLNYPGFHVWLVVVGGVALSLALHGLPWPRANRRLSSWPVSAVAALLAGTAFALPPSARARVQLASDESASLYRFIAQANAAWRRPHFSVVDAGERPAVPAGPPLVSRNDPIILLITVDALRGDVFRNEPEVVPNLRLLAEEGVDFTRAYAPSSETKGTLASVFAGRHITGLCWKYVEFRTWRALFPDTDTTPRVPELFTASGFDTFTVPSTERLLPKYGISRGFARLHELPLESKQQLSRKVMPHFRRWLDDPSAPKRFAFVHLMDAHDPYDSVTRTGAPIDRYRAEVRVADGEIGKLVAKLKDDGLWERVILVVTADHGEAFGEHNQKTHGGSVYEELTHVPLIIRVPGVAHREVDTLVSGLDLGPTLLDLAGLETPGAYLGRSLVPLLRGESLEPRPAPIESLRGHRALVFPDGTKIIAQEDQGSVELYDLEKDPGELDNLADDRPDVESRFDALDTYFRTNEKHGFGCKVKNMR